MRANLLHSEKIKIRSFLTTLFLPGKRDVIGIDSNIEFGWLTFSCRHLKNGLKILIDPDNLSEFNGNVSLY